ncbi:MAG TPA: hypothetical protein VLB84_09500, partial [Bacteroidia bacterium]|nr:hypothetical protein [Bacteroidia bacterium]
HWHMLGDVGAGQYFKNSSIHQSYNRAITIHGTESTLVENNFFYDHIGHGVFLEDGSERFNVIRKNVTLLTKRPAPSEQVIISDNQFADVQNQTPSSYWITNPQNTFEDNVAAGTQGTGYWFIFPQHPVGPSATDSRFLNLEPWKLPMISFKGNSAHSCNSGFDVFDQLGSDHSIIVNQGWAESSSHFIDNCTWYANGLALYAGIGDGGPSNNLIFTNNIFVENLVSTMFACYCIVDQSVFVANSGENLLSGERYAYRVYDGAGQVRNSHFIGWDATNANFLLNAGAATKHPNHLFTGITKSSATNMRCSLENFDIKPVHAEANDPGHPRYWSVVLRDVTGGISGKANTSIVSNHPFLLVGDEFLPTNWINTYRSDHRFVLSRLSYSVTFPETPNIICTRQKTGTDSRSVYYVDGYKEWHQLPFLVNEGYEYTYQYESLPSIKTVKMNMEDATVGDYYVARFKDFGKLGGLAVTSSQSSFTLHTSLTNLRNATSSGYYVESNGDLYIKAIATGSNQFFNLNWTSNFTVPLIDSDGDEMTDGEEISNGRDPFKANDLMATFNVNGKFEGWTGFEDITGQSVSNGTYSGTSSGIGDAQIINNAYNFNAQQVPHLFVRLRASQNTTVQLFFVNSSFSDFSASRVVSADYTGNGAYQTLAFNMKAHPDWNNTITDLRIDPVMGINISFNIDWIQAPCPDANQDADGDKICNFADVCPVLDDRLIGSPCNDGNPLTIRDAWTTSCSCTGTPAKINPTGVLQITNDEGINIFPNPFVDILHFQLKEA